MNVRCHEFSDSLLSLAVSLAKLQLIFSKLSAFFSKYFATPF